MHVVLNGSPREVNGQTLDAVMHELGYDGAVVATALNGAFVARADRLHTRLSENDKIEVLAPMQGG